jgi:hypothetical protein
MSAEKRALLRANDDSCDLTVAMMSFGFAKRTVQYTVVGVERVCLRCLYALCLRYPYALCLRSSHNSCLRCRHAKTCKDDPPLPPPPQSRALSADPPIPCELLLGVFFPMQPTRRSIDSSIPPYLYHHYITLAVVLYCTVLYCTSCGVYIHTTQYPIHLLCCNLFNYTRQRFCLFSCARALACNL